jgi:hypothetical protein
MSTPSISGRRIVCLSIALHAARVFGQDAATTFTLPAGKLVILRLTERVDSDHNLPGFKFGFQVAEPVRVDGHILIPADSPGEGVVLHSAVSGHQNQPGELVLAARFVRVGGVQVELRSFVAGSTDRANDSLAVPAFDRLMNRGRGGVAFVGKGGMASARVSHAIELPEVIDPRAPGSSFEDSPPPPGFDSTTGTVVFYREDAHVSGGDVFKIREGEVVLGELRRGERFTAQVPAGRHLWSSRGSDFVDLVVEVDPGEIYYFACGSRGTVFTKYCAPSNRRAYESYFGR